MVQAFIISFLRLDQFTFRYYLGAPFVGFRNYYEVLFVAESPIRLGLTQAFRNTVIYAIIVTVGQLFFGMIVALLLNRQFKGRRVFRTLFLFPWIVPTYIVGLLWGFMWQKHIGIINYLLTDVFGIFAVRPFWLMGRNAIWAIIIPTIWRFWPFAMLLLLAGLQTIPDDYYDAASIDGASAWNRFWKITWPMLKPVWSILILFGMIYNVYSFNIVMMMFGHGAGFPGEWGDLLMTNLFRNSFNLWEFGTGAAASIVLMFLMIGLVLIWYRIFKKELIAK